MKFVSNLDFNSTSKIVNASVPTANQDGATKNYADTTIGPPSLPTIRIFTSSGTWTRPANCKKIKVTVVGGGGKGGRISTPDSGSIWVGVAGGGGGGGTNVAFIDVTGSDYSTAITVTIGSGATANEGTGGTSSFNTGTALSITATGGQAPEAIVAEDVNATNRYNGVIGSGGAGGSGTRNTGTGYLIHGGGGIAGTFSISGASSGAKNIITGVGGRSFLSGRGASAFVDGSDTVQNGVGGMLYGGGGGGGALLNSSSDGLGGNGAAGIVIVEEFY